MKPAEMCRAAGLSGLAELEELTGVGRRTLSNWHKDKPLLFKIVLIGAVQLKTETLPAEVLPTPERED
jgi:transcriptional regulator with XRE-family HTH domain